MARMTLAGADIEVRTEGSGRPLLFLHGEGYFDQHRSFFEELAGTYRDVIPQHPGFGSSSLPDTFNPADDLAYLSCDLIEAMTLERPVLVGASLGGWVALDMPVKAPATFDTLALLGIKQFHDHVGGFSHFLDRGGHISHEDTVANLKLFSKEVLPRRAELSA